MTPDRMPPQSFDAKIALEAGRQTAAHVAYVEENSISKYDVFMALANNEIIEEDGKQYIEIDGQKYEIHEVPGNVNMDSADFDLEEYIDELIKGKSAMDLIFPLCIVSGVILLTVIGSAAVADLSSRIKNKKDDGRDM